MPLLRDQFLEHLDETPHNSKYGVSVVSKIGFRLSLQWHHNGAIAAQITNFTIVYSSVYSGADQRKHQSPASLAFVREIHRWPVTRKMFPLDDIIMVWAGAVVYAIICYIELRYSGPTQYAVLKGWLSQIFHQAMPVSVWLGQGGRLR